MKITVYVLIFMLSLKLSAQQRYPSYQAVVNTFFKKHTTSSYDDYKEISFQKKATGWHVATKIYEDGQYQEVESELFWDRNSNSFKSLTFEKRVDDPSSAFNQSADPWSEDTDPFLQAWEASLFDIYPYFNYDGWDRDIIKDYGEKEATLSDTTLYALGRAYSSYASHLLGRSESNDQFTLARHEKLSKSQLKEYRKHRHGAIRAFGRLKDHNPDFQTIIGSIGVKWANEHVTSYIDLMMYSDEQEALSELNEDIYDDFHMALARNYLNSCAPNAVLFTGGDNDTFPLWYLQAKYGYRRDVTVIVVSFLNTNRFMDLVAKEDTHIEPLSFSIDMENYDINGPNAYLPQIDQVEGPIDVKSYLNLINNGHEALRLDVDESYYNILPSSELKIPVKTFFEQKSLPEHLSKFALDSVMLVSVKTKGIEMRDLALLDFITTNNWDRPIYFNSTSLYRVGLNFSEYVVQEGLCYQLLPVQKENAVDYVRMYDVVKNKFDWDFLPLSNQVIDEERNFVLNYRSVVNSMVEAFLEAENQGKAKEILLASYSWMPKDVFPLDYFNAKQIDYLLQLEEPELAIKMADQLFYHAANKLEELASNETEELKNAEEVKETQKNLYIIHLLIDSFTRHNMNDLANKYEPTLLKYEALIPLY